MYFILYAALDPALQLENALNLCTNSAADVLAKNDSLTPCHQENLEMQRYAGKREFEHSAGQGNRHVKGR